MRMDVPVRPGDVLPQPTRARLFSLLSERRGPVGTEVLAEKLKMHPNGVRLHLERLLEAGLVERRQERIARGRPRDVWTVSAEAQPGGDPPTGYAELARWLVGSLVASGARTEDMEAAGGRIGQGLAGERPAGDKDEQWLFDSLTALGFQPERERVGGNRRSYRLRNCPYREAVHAHQPLVCALHRGLTNGLLQSPIRTPRWSGSSRRTRIRPVA
jgi:predicted ArsR family transcriptional regulator